MEEIINEAYKVVGGSNSPLNYTNICAVRIVILFDDMFSVIEKRLHMLNGFLVKSLFNMFLD